MLIELHHFQHHNKIQEYITFRLKVGEHNFINGEESENLVSTVIDALYIDMSELYLFYIKLLVNINDDDDILIYLTTVVRTRALLIISNINNADQ